MQRPNIPTTVREVPQQRVYPVISLPQRPPTFRGRLDALDPMPQDVRPKGSPRNLIYLGSVEWAWSPDHDRVDSYYLNPRGKYWLLWNRWEDFNQWTPVWRWSLYGYARRNRVDEKSAAIYLLLDGWMTEKIKWDLDHYLLIDAPGLLSVAEISEIARIVWPDERASG